MQETTNLGLMTYEASDPTDWLADFNYNMNKIDEAVGNQNSSIATVTATANQANSTATLANTTAESALSTANSKASIDDLATSDSTTYSSEKIDELIEGAGGAVIDDSTTSLSSTWSSSKINTEIEAVETIANSKASINDSTASATTTYSSNKIETEVSAVETLANSKTSINDSTASSSTTYSSTKINSLNSTKQNKTWTLLTSITPTTSYVNYTVSNLSNYNDLVFELQHSQYTADSCFIPDTMFVNADTVVLQDTDGSTRNLFNIGFVNSTTIKAKCEYVWTGYSIKIYAR